MTQRTSSVNQTLKNKNLISYNSSVNSRLGPLSNIATVLILVTLAGLLYLTQITKTSTYSYQINELENSYDKLLKENQSLEIESARIRSIESLSGSAEGYVDVRSEDVEFTN